MLKFYLTAIVTLIFCFSIFGQTNPPTAIPSKEVDDRPIKVNTLLLNMPVIASDREGRNISGLKKDDFTITQNGEKQPIEFFSDEYGPMNVAIVVDTSGSTLPIRANIKKAAQTFLTTLRPEDMAMIVSFDGKFKILSELSSDQKQLGKAIDKLTMLQLDGTTMYDAIDEVINKKFAAVKGRKAIILLTDGIEGSTRISREAFMRTLSESDTVIYPILFLFGNVSKDPIIQQYLDYLRAMAAATAGRICYGGSDLQIAFQSIADEMKKQYLIGFYPQAPEVGKPPEIKIDIVRKDVVLRTKRSIRIKDRTIPN